MVFLSSSRQAQDEITFQGQGKSVDATAETGPATPPPQKEQQGLPLAPTSTPTARETSVVERHVDPDGDGGAPQRQPLPLATPVSAMKRKMPGGGSANDHGASAAILPPYPYQASPTQKSGRMPLLGKTGASEEQRPVGGEEKDVPTMDVAP
jgi:hypothetical protein